MIKIVCLIQPFLKNQKIMIIKGNKIIAEKETLFANIEQEIYKASKDFATTQIRFIGNANFIKPIKERMQIEFPNLIIL